MLSLEGIKVVDLTHAIAGSFCSVLLGDMGADVIKIEPPHGEMFRPALGGVFVPTLNRNKRGLALDLTTEQAREVVLKLAEDADVFIENFTPGTVEKFGLDYKVISGMNDRIVYCSISGFGQTGPYRDYPAFDPVIQALTGFMMATGEPGRPPVRVFPSLIDCGAAMYAAYGIALALLVRERTGKGQRVDTTLIDTAVSWMGLLIADYSVTGKVQQRYGSAAPWGAPYQAFSTKDALIFLAVLTEKAWKDICAALDLNDIVDDPRFVSDDMRSQNKEELAAILGKVFEQYGSEELLAKLQAVDVPCAPILTIDKVIEAPQVVARDLFVDMDYPGLGKMKLTKIPELLCDMPSQIRQRAPLLGEHTDEILTEIGYTEHQIQHLRDSGVIL